MSDIERWITVNGQHIPIMKGESKAQAVGRFIKEKRDERKSKVVKDYIDRNDRITRKSGALLDKENEYDESARKFHEEINTLKTKVKDYQKPGNSTPDSYELRNAVKEEYKSWHSTNQVKEAANRILNPLPIGTEITVYDNNRWHPDSFSIMKKVGNNTWQEGRGDKTGIDWWGKVDNYKTLENMYNDVDENFNSMIVDNIHVKYNKSKYKLKEDTPKTETAEKRKITGVKKGLSQKEIRKLYKQEDYTDIISTLDRGQRYSLKDAYKDLDYYDSRSSRYKVIKSYINDMEAKAANLYKARNTTYKKVDSTKAQRVAYQKYLKEHPNSKMKFSTFKTRYNEDGR